MKVQDADGVELRSSHRLARRTCVSVGPNCLWHIDGYDKIKPSYLWHIDGYGKIKSNYLWHIDGYHKIKPYGFTIHGARDGFRRKILWLRVASSINSPKVIASYYWIV